METAGAISRLVGLAMVMIPWLPGCDLISQSKKGVAMIPEITYWSNAADEALPMQLSVSQTGDATLTIMSNRDRPDVANGGVFRMKVREGDIAALVEGLRSPGFQSIQNPVSVLSGSLIRKISFREEGNIEVTKFVGEDAPAPPAFLNAEALALELVRVVRQHPVYAIALKVSGLPDEFERRAKVQFKIAIENPSSGNIKILPPPRWTEEAVGIELVALRSDIALADLRSYHQRFERLTAADVKSFQPSDIPERMLELATDQRMTLSIEKQFDWPPGEYEVKVFYATTIYKPDGAEAIRCELTVKPHRLKVTGKSRPDDNR